MNSSDCTETVNIKALFKLLQFLLII